MKKITSMIIIMIMLCLVNPLMASAQEVIYRPPNVDVMFVLDFSYSMNTNDRDKMAIDMIKMFIDTLPSERVNVGYVAYNHTIISSMAPAPIRTDRQRDQIKKPIEEIRKTGYSDLGMGLKTGFDLLTAQSKDNTEKIIILISDGETALPQNSQRTHGDSDNDVNAVLKASKELGIPIYTVSIGDEFEGSDILTRISDESGGSYYEDSTSRELIEIFAEIMQGHMSSKIKSVAASMGTGGKQEIIIPIKDSLITEANILFIASSPIQQPKIYYLGNDVSFADSKYYFVAKIADPPAQEVKLEFVSNPGDMVKVFLLANYDISLVMDLPAEIYKNEPMEIETVFRNDDDGRLVDDPEFYRKITPRFTFVSDDRQYDFAIEAAENKLKARGTFDLSGKYDLLASFQHEDFKISFEEYQIQIENRPPRGKFDSRLVFPKIAGTRDYDLKDYFVDEDGDPLTFEILTEDLDSRYFHLEDSMLTIDPYRLGRGTFMIQAIDHEGAVLRQEVYLRVMPTLQYYYPVPLGLLVMALGYYYYRRRKAPKPCFTGKINGYVIYLKGRQQEYPPLSIPLNQFDGKKRITLRELLEREKIDCTGLHADLIYFEPGIERSVVLFHKSDANLIINGNSLEKNKKLRLEYKNKIYITFSDGESEIELHYLRHNTSSEMA